MENETSEQFPRHAHGLATDPRPFGQRLKFWREQRALTLEQVGVVLGVNKGQVSRYEAGGEPASVMAAVRRLRDAQREAGETPGQDSVAEVRAIWQKYMAAAKGGG